MAPYAGLLLTPAESFNNKPRFILPFRQKRTFCGVLPILCHFLCSVVILVTLNKYEKPNSITEYIYHRIIPALVNFFNN